MGLGSDGLERRTEDVSALKSFPLVDDWLMKVRLREALGSPLAPGAPDASVTIGGPQIMLWAYIQTDSNIVLFGHVWACLVSW